MSEALWLKELPESYRTHIFKIESLDSEMVRQFFMRTSQLGPFISRDLVSLANKDLAFEENDATPDETSSRDYEIGTKLLRFFNGLDTEDYKAVLASEI